ncbi:MAG: M28 family peptidase [Saprospiraceae bacterium]|nr:M28 family peptidase [Saprospiraceae bacterium]
MKTFFSLAILMAFSLSFVSAQNTAPQVVITNVAVDEPSQAVYVTYDLLDQEYDPCEVWFGISLDGGATFLVENGTVFGDIGTGIQPGTNRQISWFAQDVPDLYQAVIRVVADDGHPVDIQSLVDQVDEPGLYDRLGQIAIKRHHSAAPSGLDEVRDSILSALNQYGLQVEEQPTTYQGATYPNILGRQGGWVHEDTTYIVDAHYDGVSAGPGADDNATGTVAMMEVARILSQVPCRKSLRYIGFCFEEQGLVGSNQYVNKGGIKPWEKISGVLNMEMIGYFSNKINSQDIPPGFDLLFPAATADIEAQLNRGNFLIVVGNVASQSLIDTYVAAADQYVPQLRTVSLAVPGNGQIAPDLRRSDHSRFWDDGYPALMLTDGAETRNKNYHTSKDVIDSLNLTFFAQNVRATLATAATLAEPMHAGMDHYQLSDLVGIQDGAIFAFPCEVRLSPNPASDQLVVQFGDCTLDNLTLTLYTADGRRLQTQQLPEITPEGVHFSLSDQPSGTYLLTIRTGKYLTSRRIFVK